MTSKGKTSMVYCRWSKTPHRGCQKTPIAEMQSLTGKWSPICKYHLELKKRNNANNPWGSLFEIKTRELTHPYCQTNADTKLTAKLEEINEKTSS